MNNIFTQIRQPSIEQTPIVVSLDYATDGETGQSEDNNTEIQQTKASGILYPLLSINGKAIAMGDIIDYRLDFRGHIPELEFWVNDKGKIISKYLAPGPDNEVRTEILPTTDKYYKKIDLTFYIQEFENEGDGTIHCICTYKLMELTNVRFTSFKKSTYELCDEISVQTQLGFSSNVQTTDDSRYIILSCKSYADALSDEIEYSQADENQVYDFWIDQWNNINLVNIRERIVTQDSEDDLKVYVTPNTTMFSKSDPVQEEEEVVPVFTTEGAHNNTPLFISNIEHSADTGAYKATGNSIILGIYEESINECIDHQIIDGDVKEDISQVYQYGGEVFGEYNYLFNRYCRDLYLKKIATEKITITTPFPCLGLYKGRQVRLVTFDNDPYSASLADAVENDNSSTELKDANKPKDWLAKYDYAGSNSKDAIYKLNMMLSGQYTIMGISYEYRNNKWEVLYDLIRDPKNKPQTQDVYTKELKDNKR